MQLDSLALENLLLLDIETVPAYEGFDNLSPSMQELWLEKFAKIAPQLEDGKEGYVDRAGIFAEFGRIICISVGYFYKNAEKSGFRIKSIAGDDEKMLLNDFLELVDHFAARKKNFLFAGHNVKEFDIPYICRRSVIHGLALPRHLQLHGFKPWEVPMLDTLHLWRFGDIKHYISLKLMAAVLGIESPKDDISGNEVAGVYYKDHDLERITEYCQKDVITVAQILLRFKRLKLLTPDDITLVE